MDESKAQGNILGWPVYTAMPRSPDEPNLYLVVSMVARNNMRIQIGSEVIREVVFK